MYSLKLAHLVHERSGAKIYNFYIDMRSAGKGYEEFYNHLLEEGCEFIRGRVAEVSDWAVTPMEKDKLVIRVEDTLAGLVRRIPVDMVVLSTGLEAREDAGRRAADVQHVLLERRLVPRAAPEARAGLDLHRRRLHRRVRAGAEGHPRHRGPGRRRGGGGHGAHRHGPGGARGLHRLDRRRSAARAARSACRSARSAPSSSTRRRRCPP